MSERIREKREEEKRQVQSFRKRVSLRLSILSWSVCVECCFGYIAVKMNRPITGAGRNSVLTITHKR